MDNPMECDEGATRAAFAAPLKPPYVPPSRPVAQLPDISPEHARRILARKDEIPVFKPDPDIEPIF